MNLFIEFMLNLILLFSWLINRPHGQHAVVLAEDASKIMGKIDCQNISASQQIYLTFPADSTFSEEDVSNYFR